MQFKQAVIPGVGWLRPLVQTSQSVSCAAFDAALPISQSTHLLCLTWGCFLPGMQFKQAVIPEFGWLRPLVQTSQSVSCATFDDALPIAQSMQLSCFFLD